MDKNYRGIAYKFGRNVHLDTLQCVVGKKMNKSSRKFWESPSTMSVNTQGDTNLGQTDF